jgi:hypothetical protein
LEDYIAFLQWREGQGQAAATANWSFSFIEAFKTASISASENPAGMDVQMGPALVGGQRRPALWAHPPVAGQAVIEYYVPIPQQVSEVQLRLAIGIRDGAQIAEHNLVAFGVRVNGARVWGQQSNTLAWQEVTIPLDLSAGDMVRFEFTTEALNGHEWTWAVWGSPELRGKLGTGNKGKEGIWGLDAERPGGVPTLSGGTRD